MCKNKSKELLSSREKKKKHIRDSNTLEKCVRIMPLLIKTQNGRFGGEAFAEENKKFALKCIPYKSLVNIYSIS